MSIQDFRIGISIDDSTIECDGVDVVEVSAIVTIKTDGQQSTYAVSILDYNVIYADSQLCDRQVQTIPPRDPSVDFHEVHRFSLNCDSQCFVSGNYGSARETKADVYALGEEWNGLLQLPVQGGASQKSGTIPVRCVRGE